VNSCKIWGALSGALAPVGTSASLHYVFEEGRQTEVCATRERAGLKPCITWRREILFTLGIRRGSGLQCAQADAFAGSESEEKNRPASFRMTVLGWLGAIQDATTLTLALAGAGETPIRIMPITANRATPIRRWTRSATSPIACTAITLA
jgi:hypothetical protein